MRKAFHLCGLPPPKPRTPAQPQGKHRLSPHRGPLYETPDRPFSNCQGRQKQGKSEKLSQTGGGRRHDDSKQRWPPAQTKPPASLNSTAVTEWGALPEHSARGGPAGPQPNHPPIHPPSHREMHVSVIPFCGKGNGGSERPLAQDGPAGSWQGCSRIRAAPAPSQDTGGPRAEPDSGASWT